MTIEIRPATDFDDVKPMVGPKRPDADVCWCLGHRFASMENRELRGKARARQVERLLAEGPIGVFAYAGEEVVGWAAVAPRAEAAFARVRQIRSSTMLPSGRSGACGCGRSHRGESSRATYWQPRSSFTRELAAPAIEGYPRDSRGEKVDLTMATSAPGRRSKGPVQQGKRHRLGPRRLPAAADAARAELTRRSRPPRPAPVPAPVAAL